MGSKTFVFLGLSMAIALLISSEVVSSRDLAETQKSNVAATIDQSGECTRGRCGEAELAKTEATTSEDYTMAYRGGGRWNKRGGGYPGVGCRNGRCGRHCCYAGQKADAETQN